MNFLSPKNEARCIKSRKEKIGNLEKLSSDYKKELKQLLLSESNLIEQLLQNNSDFLVRLVL